MGQGKILAIDDEQNIRRLIRNEFSLEGYDVTTAQDGEEGLRLFGQKDFDVILLDFKLPKMSGLDVLREIKSKSTTSEVIMITGYGDIRSAVDSLKLGARDYITKPFKLDELISIVDHAIRENRERSQLQGNGGGRLNELSPDFILCPSPAMQKVYSLVERVSLSDHTILIQGETGVGKDVLAFHIHRKSRRNQGPFVVVDCGLLSQNLAESELYGHRKGAFSGAAETKVGLVEKSHSGSLFLDEIGNIDLGLQKKFLRFLETRKFRRIGETRELSIDTRIILATNMDLESAVRSGDLRSDLFYRMAEITLVLPPLRERPDDIIPLAEFFLSRYAQNGRGIELTPEAQKSLTHYTWPGNIRELKSVMGKMVLLADSPTIRSDDLPAHIKARMCELPCKTKTLEDMEKEHIIHVLAEAEGNQTKASEILGINRKTLYKKIQKFKIFS